MQDERKNIKSEELEISQKTGGDIFSLKKEEPTHTYTKEDYKNKISDSTDSINSGTVSTPAEISKMKYYDSEKKKNDAKTKLFNTLRWLAPLFVALLIGLLSFFSIVWVYKLKNIAEPIGGIKAEINNLIKDNDKNEIDIGKLEDRINRFLEMKFE